ncbi:hemagglutinin repeat-containing protein [Pseudomonas sp. NPDC099000]|uniref:two-partner secretion domain-containing protein n=1 Tax=Pseudomonas sp. NPDC099000 TaxID=3364488 RepID=UPI00383B8117
MDARQFAFLSRQPSSSVKTREHFWGMPKRGLAFLLANVMFWQPMWAQAEGIVVASPGTSLGQAGNGVPIVNIATPNGTGLSHNQFHDYNVGTQGVILNNVANQTGATQLGGIIVGNPNLTNRVAAQTILNEVVGGSPSQLRGYTEVAGQSARVIVANPYGISCNGCGFINTPRVTLTTGKPVLDNGRVDRYQVDQGSVSIDGAGLNANNVDSFEIITRSAKINAEIQAKNLTIVAGRNDVNAQTLNATARADDGSAKPQLAIDSSALGGMYAGAIKLVGTEAGVGVKLAGNLAASGGDIQIDANGHLSLAQTSAAGAVNVKAASLDAQGPVYAGSSVNVQTQGNLTNQQTLAARDGIVLNAGGQLTNNGIIEAGVNADNSRNANGDVSLIAQNLNNTGKSVVASRNLSINTAQTLSNQGGTLSAQHATNINAGTLDNQNNGRVQGSGAVSLSATQVLNTQGVITSNGNLTATLGHLNNNNGEVSSAGNTSVSATTLDNSDGQVTGDVALNIGLIGALNNRNGVLGSGQSVSIHAASLDNSHGGSLVSDGSLTARITGLFDNQNGDLSAQGAVDLQTGSLDNRNGNLTGKDRLTLRSDSLDNRTGKVRASNDLQLNVGQLDNRQQGLLSSQAAINFNGTHLDNRGGLLSAAGPVRLDATSVDNSGGRLSSKTDLTANVGQFTNQTGELVAQGMLTLSGKGLDNRNGGLVGATKALKINVDEMDNRGGEISSAVDVSLQGLHLNNSDNGKILAGTDLGLKVAQILNQTKGLVFGKGIITVAGQSLDNSGGSLVTQSGLDIRLDNALSNIDGLISSEGTLTVNAASLDNTRGSLSSADALAVTTTGALINQGGSITTNNGLTLKSQNLNNSQSGLLSGKNAITVTTGAFDNTQGGRLISGDTLDLTATQVSNGVGSRIASEKALTASVIGFDQQGGQLFSKTSLSLDVNNGQLNNQNGLINAPLLMLKNLNDVNNQGGEISSAQAFTLAARSLDNSNGRLISNQGLTLRIEQLLASIKGLIAAQTVDVHSARLDNSGGLISSRGTLGLTVEGQLVNQDGTLIADGDVHLSADNLDNTGGQIAGKTDVTANVATLDNHGGQLVATGALTLTGTHLDNRDGGLVGANNALQLTIGSVDNRGGELSSKSDVTLVGTTLNNSDGGQVFAEGALSLTVDQVINRAKGLLSGKTDLMLSGRELDNSGGTLLSQKNLKVDLTADLNNSQGVLSAEGTLDVTAASLTNTLGTLSAAGPLTLTTTGVVLNQAGEIVTDAGLTLKSASLDNRNKGSISGKGAVVVNTGSLDNSHDGRLNSGASLSLTATQLTNQDKGRIASVGALTASVTGLDQQDGQLFSNTSLELDLNHGQLNNQTGLISAPLLMLKNLADVNNTGNGEISSAQAFTLAARSLDNSTGKVLSNQSLTLRIEQALTSIKGMIAAAALDVKAASLDNSGGTLTSLASLDLNLDGQLKNRDLGLINGTTGLTINSSGIDNQNGSLLGSAIAIDFGAATGDLNNSGGGMITTTGALSIQHLRDLNNRSGEISSSQSIDLKTHALDNRSGRLISKNLLTVNADTVNNQGGLISGWKGLSLTSNSLDNRNKGTLSSGHVDNSVNVPGDMAVTVSGDLLNSANGALVSLGNLSVNAANLDNSSTGILSSAGAQTLTLSGLLNNAQGGLISSGATLAMQAMTLGNASGTVNAEQALSFTGTTLDNTGGNLAGNAAVTVDLLGALTNTNGKLASGGSLLIQRTTQINNQGGQLASQGLMTLLTDGLDNRNRGTVAANDLLTITTPGAVQNSADGLIYSQNGDLKIQAASLANAKGTLQSGSALSLKTDGDIDNQSGRIVAKAGDLSITAGNLDNRGGVLSSLQAAFTVQLTGVLKNGYDLNNNRQGGITQAQRLNLTALGGIDNYGGRLSAQSGDAIIATGNFDNRNGGLYAKGKINVTGNNFDNSGDNGGQVAGQQIDLNLTSALNNRLGIIESDSTLAIKAASLDNQTGQLRALGTSGKTSFQIGGLFDNRNGTLESANTDLGMAVGSFLNGGGSLLHVGNGTFDISTANVTGAGGTIVTRGGLTLNADTWSNSNVIQAGRLTVNVNNFTQTASGQLLASDSLVGTGINWFNEGLIASDGSLSVGLSGAYWGGGRLSSLGTLGLSAAQVSLNAATSSIAGGGNTTLNISGQLDNGGRLTSAADLTVNSGGINNFGTLAGAQKLTVTTGTLVNSRGLIFSGGDMQLLSPSFTNSYGQVYSLGSMLIARDKNGTKADLLDNRSAGIDSTGDLTIAATTVNNVMDVLQYTEHEKSVATITSLPCALISYGCDSRGGGRINGLWEIAETDRLKVTLHSEAASINSGADLTINAGEVNNISSNVTASGDLAITASTINNKGLQEQEILSTRRYVSWVNETASAISMAGIFTQRNNPTPSATVEQDMSNFLKWMGETLPANTRVINGESLDAIIQAGGNVSLNAAQNINNSVVRPYYAYVAAGRSKADTGAGSAYSTPIYINAQLPPNLAQQQVNPLALPGFSLPTGQNGLFRLSGQDSSTPVASGPQSWTMGGATVSPIQRQQPLPDAKPRDIQLAGNAQVSATTADLTTVDRQAPDMFAGASAIDVSAPLADSTSAALPGRATALTVNRVQGLPAGSQSKPHKYLIETNPVLTDLKQFMSSDYLLSNLGYDPDNSAKRLGDGLYEQRLIQQAVVARTGQRFIDGQTSDEALFKYLMNNAIASKNELNLALGVSLTSEQVAALTHDIVWMENAVVNGEQVLVPVLYLANANNRLAANGALIQGRDVTLIAGQDLNNAGTLRASNNLSATAGNDLVTSGLVEAGSRLDLLAGNNLVNKAGGIIAGRDVTLTATRGDVINERSITTHESGTGAINERKDFVNSAARIEAANALTLNAGRDINNTGGVLKSGADTTINAGRDVNLVSAEQVVSSERGLHRNDTVTQYGSDVDVGQSLKVNAGRDLTVIASQIDAKRDVNMSAVGDLILASAADEQHAYGANKKFVSQEDHVSQVSTTVNAGGTVSLNAGKDLSLIASRVSAGDEAYLVAGGDLLMGAAQDEDYSFYSKTKKSSSGKKSLLEETSSTTNVGSSVTAQGKTVLAAGKDLLIEGSNVISEKGSVGLAAGNDVKIVAVTDSSSARHESSSSKSSWGGLKSSKVKDAFSETQTTAVGSLISGNTVAVSGKRDVDITGSAVVSTEDLTVRAVRDLTINAAENIFTRNQTHQEKNRDLTGVLTGNKLGIDDITGNQHLSVGGQKHNGTMSQTTLTGSTVGSSAGNVSLVAGGNLDVIASDLFSIKDMTLMGADVSITSGMESSSQNTTDKSNNLGVGRVLGGSIIDTVNTIRTAVKAANDAEDPRLKAVKLAQAALAGYNLGGMGSQTEDAATAYGDKQGGSASNGSLIKIGTELANTHSKATSEYNSQTAKQSTVNAGGGLTIIANGNAAGSQGDIHVTGSSLNTAGTAVLNAKNDIVLESAQNTADWANNNTSNKTAIGASFNIGQQNGFTLDLGASGAKGTGTGSSITQVNTTLNAGALVLRSGGDTTLAGAQVTADSIDAKIDGNLNIISRQDVETQENKQGTAGFGASICVPPFCYGTTVTGSASVSFGNMDSEYKAVTDQTGLFAGAGGYNLDVGKNTTLVGGVIASEASADKNVLSTDRLIVSDIKNVSEVNAQSGGASVSGSYGGGSGSASVGGLYGVALSDSDSSKTRSAVSDGTITVRNPEGSNDLVGLNRDTTNANEQLDKPDIEAMKERVELVKSAIELSKGISDAIAAAKMEEANDRDSETSKVAIQKLKDQGYSNPTDEQIIQQVQRDYGMGSSFQKAAQAVTSIVQGVLGGNIAGALAGAAAPYVAQAIRDATKGDKTANLMAHAVLGALVAKANGGSTLAGAVGAVAAEEIARILKEELYGDVSNDKLSAEQKQTISSLSTLVAGIGGAFTGTDSLDAVTAALVGKNAVENNGLSAQDVVNWASELISANKKGESTEGVWEKYKGLSAQKRAEMLTDCAGTGGACTLYYQSDLDMGITVADSVSALSWFFNLSSDEARRLNQYVDEENRNDMSLLYEALPTWEKVALVAKDTADALNLGAGGVGGSKTSVASVVARNTGSKTTTGSKTSSGPVVLSYDKNTRTWSTPAGLDYGEGSEQGNRVKHVLEHSVPNPNKRKHSVFSMDRKDILGVVDEAWIKKGNPVVGDPGAYIVPMSRVVGTAGETNIKIVVRPGTSIVITAYPFK